MADLPPTAVCPISLAYSGSTLLAALPSRVASCQARRNASRMATDRMAARRRNDRAIGSLPLPASDPPDLKRVDILVGLGRLEGLAHPLDRSIGDIGRRACRKKVC